MRLERVLKLESLFNLVNVCYDVAYCSLKLQYSIPRNAIVLWKLNFVFGSAATVKYYVLVLQKQFCGQSFWVCVDHFKENRKRKI